MNTRTYRDLIAWQKAMQLAKQVYCETRQMPEEERYGLTIQMRRAAISVPSNIAEGYGRADRKDLLRFLRVARGSLMELQTQIILTKDLQLINPSDTMSHLQEETDRVLQGLIRSLQNKKNE
jgi:four helix bundle protein